MIFELNFTLTTISVLLVKAVKILLGFSLEYFSIEKFLSCHF